MPNFVQISCWLCASKYLANFLCDKSCLCKHLVDFVQTFCAVGNLVIGQLANDRWSAEQKPNYLHTPTIQPTAMHLPFTCEQPPPPTTMHQLYTMLHLNRPISTTHIQYQPNTIKYNAMHQNAQHLPSIVSCSPKCFVRLCTSPVQMCEPSASKLCKYVRSMCEVWKFAKYEHVQSMKVCEVQASCASMKMKPDHSLMIRQPLSLHTDRKKKRHQERT